MVSFIVFKEHGNIKNFPSDCSRQIAARIPKRSGFLQSGQALKHKRPGRDSRHPAQPLYPGHITVQSEPGDRAELYSLFLCLCSRRVIIHRVVHPIILPEVHSAIHAVIHLDIPLIFSPEAGSTDSGGVLYPSPALPSLPASPFPVYQTCRDEVLR